MRYVVVATEEELRLPAAMDCGRQPIVTGVGGVNVLTALGLVDREADILNVGYAGSRWWPRGTEVRIGRCRTWHPNCDFAEPVFKIQGGEALCLTAGDFVLGGELPRGCVVDMELAYIAAMGFRYLQSVKYVSDGLDYREYEAAVKAASTSLSTRRA